MATGTDKRRREVLRAIVADYIASQEPVGSKSLLERHRLNVSSATIRNDMGVLESEGYITQQHASSGRIPTEKGYRAFVDSLHDVKPMSPAEKRAIVGFLEEGVDLEDVLRRSVQLLAQFTRQAAVIQVPTLHASRVKHCEVVALTPTRLLLVLITDTGRVDQRNVDLGEAVDDDQVQRLRQLLNNSLQSKTLRDASVSLADLAQTAPPDIAPHVLSAATVLIETLVEQPSERLIMAGASNLTRFAGKSTLRLPGIIEALEEQVVVLKLMANLPELGNVAVRIGEENEDEELQSTSIVTTAYGGEGAPLGGLGVVGPTYMDYPGTISKVSAVARYVGRILAGE
ncbi:heat-inducible transcriptional repressor HrcA [Corynebacterium yudongzhengii]|uniref:Heat-inducible transcription repressor HrcA n=1 Tax=Corynebacterium yudongzhengii TaxID=2080740 RepID=A0A2U1T7I1_9CORY|nr:heat-inducible transcriptional repressor HrcA [Corynebacterium yudongzhengii]AWB81462.1 heat-inducible transcriptional repressor HrcA [Corynebacterium yudongzhengii]PWC01966.1 heat-inducible transcriptional repressor HrcA [Corynebacterium yudongzhengii]